MPRNLSLSTDSVAACMPGRLREVSVTEGTMGRGGQSWPSLALYSLDFGRDGAAKINACLLQGPLYSLGPVL